MRRLASSWTLNRERIVSYAYGGMACDKSSVRLLRTVGCLIGEGVKLEDIKVAMDIGFTQRTLPGQAA